MPVVVVAGGSRKEILELVKHSQAELKEKLTFKVFDTLSNVDEEGLWEYHHLKTEEEMVKAAVQCVVKGEGDILLKGTIQTHTLLKEIVKKEHDLKEKTLLSHVALVSIPLLGRPILLTDSGMNITPSEKELSLIIENAIEVGHQLGLSHPKVALLSAAENINPKMPSSVLANNLTKQFEESENATVFGPLSLDLALSQEAVRQKGYEGPISGDADILVVPTIDVGNALYKALMLFGQATTGGLIVGTKVPIVLTSRSDGLESKLHALRFALRQHEKKDTLV